MQPGPDYISWADARFAEISAPSLNPKTINFAINWDPSIVMPWCRWKFSKLSCLPDGPVNEPFENQDNG